MGSATAVVEATPATPEAKPPEVEVDLDAILEKENGEAPAPDFVTELERMGPAQRLVAYRLHFKNLNQVCTFAARYPDEVPVVNGEFEWIALTLADLD
jgi:hypothetical protein